MGGCESLLTLTTDSKASRVTLHRGSSETCYRPVRARPKAWLQSATYSCLMGSVNPRLPSLLWGSLLRGSWPVSVSEASLSFIVGCNKRGPKTHGDFLWGCPGLTLFEECGGPYLTCSGTPGLLQGFQVSPMAVEMLSYMRLSETQRIIFF